MAGLVGELERLGLLERTLIVLVSDHGEAFGEHGLTGHRFQGYQEALTVPLVLRGPGVPAGRRVSTPVSLVDLVPTLLDLLGLPALPQAQGISLAPALRGEPLPEDRPLYFEWVGKDMRGVRFGPWKCLDGGQSGTLYNLAADPRERGAVAGAPEARRTAAKQLAAYAADSASRSALVTPGSEPGAERPAISDRAERSLRALGYVE